MPPSPNTGVRVVGANQPPPPASNGDAPAGSVLAQLRARAAVAREVRRLDLPVGGPWGDRLVIRYRPLAIDEMDRYAAMSEAGATGASAVSIDMMVSACETVLFRADDGELHDLECGLDGRLAEQLAAPLPPATDYPDLTPRDVVDLVFASNLFVLGPHLTQLAEWAQQAGEPGEPPAAT